MIKHYTSRIETVYLPSLWYQHVSNASTGLKSVEVVEMSQRDYRKHLRGMYTEQTKDKDNSPLDFHNAVWFNF